MPDFSNLYNPDLSDSPVQVNDPELGSLKNPALTGSGSGMTADYADQALNKFSNTLRTLTTDRMLQPVAYDYDVTNPERYQKDKHFAELGFNPFADNEERYGLRQTNWDKTKNAFGGSWSLIKNQFMEQATSWGDTFSFFGDNKSAFQQNDFEEINRQQKEMSINNPIFETEAERNGIWNFNTIANTIQQSGYAVGAIAEIAAEEAALSALTAVTFGSAGELQAARTAQLASKLGNVLRKTQKLEESINGASKLRKVFSSIGEGINKVNPIGDNTLSFLANMKNINRVDQIAQGGRAAGNLRTAARGFGSFYRDVREFNAAIAEAKAEAAGSYQDMKQLLTDQYKSNNNGKAPSAETAKEIEEYAMKAAQTNGVANTYLIMLSNKIGMGNVMSGFKPLRDITESVGNGILKTTMKVEGKVIPRLVDAADNKWLNFKQNLVRRPLGYLKTNLDEALQENLQNISHDAVQSYYQSKYGEAHGDTTHPLKSIKDHITEAASKQYSVEGAKTFISGFLTGAVIAPGNMAFSNAGNIKQAIFDRKGYNERQSAAKAGRAELIGAANSILSNPLNFDYKQGDTTVQANFGELLKNAAQHNDKKAFYDIKDDALRHMIITGIRSNTLDTMLDRIDSYTKNLTPEEFTNAFGLEYSDKNKADILKQISKFQERSAEVKEMHESVSSSLKNPFNPYQFKSEDRKVSNPEFMKHQFGARAWNDAVDNMVFMKSYYSDTVKGQNEILSALKNKKGFKNMSFDTLYSLTSNTNLSSDVEALREEIKSFTNLTDPTSKKVLAEKTKKLEQLTAYNTHLDNWEKAYDKANAMPIGEERNKALQAAFDTFKKDASPIFGDIINDSIGANSNERLGKDDLDKGFDHVHNYIKLQKESGAVLDKINLLADPENFSKYFAKHNELLQAVYQMSTMAATAEAKAEEAAKEAARPKESLTATWTGADGKEQSFTFTEGGIYVGALTKVRKGLGRKEVTQFNNDKIKVISVNKENNTVVLQLNNEEAPVTMDLEEVGKIAKEQNWVDFAKLTPIQKTYLSLRNKIITYSILDKDVKGKLIRDENNQFKKVSVKGRVKLNDKKDTLMFTYRLNGKDVTVEFNPKYVIDKTDLSSLPSAEQQALINQQARLSRNLKAQTEIFESLYNETDKKIAENNALFEANKAEYLKTVNDVKELQDELDMAVEELARIKGKRGVKEYRESLRKLTITLNREIGEKQLFLERLEVEQQALQESLTKLNEASVLYAEATFELQDNGVPFDRDGNANIYDGPEAALNEAKASQINTRLSDQQILDLLDKTEADLADVTDRIEKVKAYKKDLEELLARVQLYDEFLSDVEDYTGAGSFRKYLRGRIEKEQDPVEVARLRAMMKTVLAGGPNAENISFMVSSLNDTKRELAALQNMLQGLSEKHARLATSFEQRGNINSLQERVDFLKKVQEVISNEHQMNLAKQTIIKAGNSVKAKTKGLAAEVVEYGDILAVEPVLDPSDEEPFVSDVDKPMLSQVGLFKTADRHYWKDSDAAPTSEYAARFFKFSEHVMPNGEYHFQVVTADNDAFGIRNTDAFPDDIKIIAVKKVGNEYKPVGVDGEVLDTPTKDTIVYTSIHGNAALAGTMEEAKAWVEDNFTTKDMTPEQVIAAIADYKTFREGIKAKVAKGEPVYLFIQGKGNGIQSREPLDNQTKRPQELSLNNRLIKDGNGDWVNIKHPDGSTIHLEVSTTGSILNKKMKPGRIAMVKDDGSVFQVYNRQLNNDEKAKIIAVLKTIAPMMGRRHLTEERIENIKHLLDIGAITPDRAVELSTSLSEDEQNVFDKSIAYLSSVLYWRPVGEGQNAYKDQFFVANGMLHRGETTIPFSVDEIEKNKEMLLDGVYHQVNHVGLNDKVFYEPQIENGTVVFNSKGKWNTYSQYLLDSSNGRVSPIYTNVKPYTSKSDTANNQLRSVYLVYGYQAEQVVAPAPVAATNTNGPVSLVNSNADLLTIPEDADVVFTAKKKDGKEIYIKVRFNPSSREFNIISILDEDGEDVTEKGRSFYQKDINDTITQLKNVEGRGDNIFDEIAKDFRDYYFRIETSTGQGEKKLIAPASVINVSAVELDLSKIYEIMEPSQGSPEYSMIVKGDNFDFLAKFNKGRWDVYPKHDDGQFRASDPKTKDLLRLTNEQAKDAVEKYVPKRIIDLFEEADKQDTYEKQRAFEQGEIKQYVSKYRVQYLQREIPNEEAVLEYYKSDAYPNTESKERIVAGQIERINKLKEELTSLNKKSESPVVTPGETAAISKVATELSDKIAKAREEAKKRAGQNNNPPIDENARLAITENPALKEDVDAFREWIMARLPQITVQKVDQLINGRNWGQFVNGVIKLYEGAEKGTGYHEAFEAVWNSYLSDAEQEALAAEFRSQAGEFTNPYSRQRKPYSEASMYDVREMLADGFKDYIINDKPTPKDGVPVRNTIFRRLWNFIKKILGMSEADKSEMNSKINQIYARIEKGGYINTKAIRETNEPVYSALPGTTVDFTQQVMDGMAAIFFSKLYSSQKNVEALFGKGNNTVLFNDIYESTKDAMYAYFNSERDHYIDALTEAGLSDEEVDAEIGKFIAQDPYYDLKQAVLDDFNTTVYEEFKKFVGQFGLQFKAPKEANTVEGESDEENLENIEGKESNTVNALGIRDSIFVDPRNMTKATVRLLVASLTADEYKQNANQMQIKKNALGLPTLEDYGRKLNILLNTLHGTVPIYRDGKRVEVIDQMFEKLDKFRGSDGKYKRGFEWLQKLKSRLKYGTPIENLNEDEVRLLIAFEASFSNNKNLPVKLLVGENNNIFSVDPVVVNNITKIKERWQNNIKATSRMLKSGEDLTKAPISYIDGDGKIVFNLVSEHMAPLLNATTTVNKIDALRKLGIQFTESNDALLANNDHVKLILDSYNRIGYAFKEGLIINFDDLFGKQVVNGPINQLLSIEMGATAEDNSLGHMNAEGKQQYSITLPSAISNILNTLKGVNNLKDFILSNPQYGSVTPAGEILINPYLVNSQLLKLDGLIFDKNGKKKIDLDYQYILGMSSLNSSNGDNTDSLKFADKLVQEMYHLLDGTYFTVINSDKSSEFGIKMGHFIDWSDIGLSIDNNSFIKEAYTNALVDEINAAVFEVNNPTSIQYYSDGVTKLGHFRDVLGFVVKEKDKSPLQLEFDKKVLTGKESAEDFAARPQVQALIIDYVKGYVAKQKTFLLETGLVEEIPMQTGVNMYSSNAFSKEQLAALGIKDGTKMSDTDFTNLVKFMAINRQIGVFEQHKLLYGHPAAYKDLAKRSNGINSQKEVVTENKDVIAWMDKKMPRLDNKRRSEQKHSTFKFVSYSDPIVVSTFHKEIAQGMYDSFMKDNVTPAEAARIMGVTVKDGVITSIVGGKGTLMDAYVNATEPDGGAYIMPDFFRDMMFLSGKLGKDQAALIRWEIANEVIDRSNPKSPYYKEYTAAQIQDARKVLAEGKPSGILQTLKPQGFGYQVTEGVTHTTFLKHSVFPLTWTRVKDNPTMRDLYMDHQNKQIDIIGFESGEKVGNVLQNGGFVSLYNNEGTFNTNSTPPVQEMYTKYYGIQVEMSAKIKDHVVFGTQMRKLIMANLPAELKSLAKEYNDLIESIMRADKEALIKELGLTRTPAGEYDVTDISGIVRILRAEAISRDLPDNVINMIAETEGQLEYVFDANPIREKIDNILNSIVDSRVVSQKMFGKASVQVPVTLWESNPREYTFLRNGVWTKVEGAGELTKDEQKSVRMVASDLHFYTPEEPYMEVYIPWIFGNANPASMGFVKKDGKWMPTDAVDKNLLQAIGFRIPTQGMNSIENIRIKGFLDPSMGDVIIVPSEIVGKSGSDFDIDKMNLFLPNFNTEFYKMSLREINSFRESSHYKSLAFDVRRKIIDMDEAEFNKMITDLNKFSVTSGKGEMGNLSEHLVEVGANKETTDFLISVKDALVRYNSDRSVDIDYNKQEHENKNTHNPISYIVPGRTSKEAMQNRLIQIMSTIMSHPDNYRQLVVPNGSATLEGLAEDIRTLKGQEKEGASLTKLSEWDTMAITRERYITGKKLVGIGAIQITSHTMSQLGEVELTGTFKIKDGSEIPVKIRFDHNDKDGKLFLNAIKDKNNQYISELLSEALTGFVDAAKNPFVFDLNLNIQTAGTWFYLQKLGVPVKQIAYLHTQPIIEKYFSEQSKNESYVNKANDKELDKALVIAKAADTYIQKVFGFSLYSMGLPDENGRLSRERRGEYFTAQKKVLAAINRYREDVTKYDIGELEKNIKNLNNKDYNMSKDEAMQQLGLLYEYLDYQTQANLLSNFVNSLSYDTAKTKNIIENYVQMSNLLQARNDNFVTRDSINRVFNNTFLGEVKDQKEDIFKLFKDFFVVLHPNAKESFDKVFDYISNPDITMNNDRKIEVLNRFQNFFLTYILHTAKFRQDGKDYSLNQGYSMFFGDDSLAKELKAYQADPYYKDNIAIKQLFPLISTDRALTDNIKLFNNKMSTYEMNVISEAILNLKAQAEEKGDQKLLKFVKRLGIFAILQSGVQMSPITFTKILPIDIYSERVGNLFDRFTSPGYEIDANLVWKQFHQNNWFNTDLVPVAKQFQNVGGLISVVATKSYAKNDYVLTKVMKKEYTGQINAAREELIKLKRWDDLFTTTLYERIKFVNAEGVDTSKDMKLSFFRPINKKGNRMYLTEASLTEAPTMIAKNEYFDESQYDAAVSELQYHNDTSKDNTAIKGEIALNIIEDWVQSGQATTTVRSSSYHDEFYRGDGRYKTKAGNEINVTYKGQVRLVANRIVGDKVNLSKDEFAKAEGFGTWATFEKDAKYAGRTIIEGGMVHMYEVSPVKETAAPAKSTAAPIQEQVEAIVTAKGYVKESAAKHLPKELFKIRQATQFIGTGHGNDSTTQRMENAYKKVNAANTGKYSAQDLIYVSSNGNRDNRVAPVVNNELNAEYKNIDLAIKAGARFIMDTKAHLDSTARYNVGEVALAAYLRDKGYVRDNQTGIWSPNNNSVNSNNSFPDRQIDFPQGSCK